MKNYDCFRKQKDSAFTLSTTAINAVLQHTAEFYVTHPTSNENTIGHLEDFFYKLLRVSAAPAIIFSTLVQLLKLSELCFFLPTFRSIYGEIVVIYPFQMVAKSNKRVILLKRCHRLNHAFCTITRAKFGTA